MTSEHLKDNRRHNIVTASQAWSAVYDRKKLWREKTFREPPFKGNEMTQWGNDNEENALLAFEKHMNDICESSNKLLVHPNLPVGATSDAFLNGAVVEVKCPFSQKIYPTIPDRYWVQMQIQMLVALANGFKNAVAAHFVVWTPDDFHTELVQYDQEFIDWYIPKAQEFISYVQDDKEPPRYKRKPEFNFNKEK
jgi:predicted phage-related endonuclease